MCCINESTTFYWFNEAFFSDLKITIDGFIKQPTIMKHYTLDMKLYLIISLLALSNVAFGQSRDPFNNLNIKEDSVYNSKSSQQRIDSLAVKIFRIDSLIEGNPAQIELMAITSQSDEPVKIVNEEWPDDVMISINIIKDKNGNIIYYAKSPTSESGDWYIGYQYYVNAKTGKVYGFRRVANFYNSTCADLAKEESTYYFNPNAELIGKSYSLMDNDNKDLSGSRCFFNYDYKYEIVKNLKELMQ